MTKRPEFLPFLLTLAALVGVVALLLAHTDVPEALYGVLTAAGAAFLALVHPSGPASATVAITRPVDTTVDTPAVTAVAGDPGTP